MKTFKLVLKIAVITALICGIVFTIVYFRDDIKNFCTSLKKNIKKACPLCGEETDFDDI